jgi:3-isopropylmalate dehydrogenase
MTRHIVTVPGDGIGPDVTREAIATLRKAASAVGVDITTEEHLIGGASLDAFGVPIREEVLVAAKRADAIFLGAVGGPAWDTLPADLRPEQGLLALRKALGLYTNLRPVTVIDELADASTLKREIIAGTDMLVVRELTGGLYFGEPKRIDSTEGGGERAIDTMVYTTDEIRRIAHAAFKAARQRRKRVTSVDKANILATSQLWRRVVTDVASDYPDVALDHMLVDNCAMQLVRRPTDFDVILTENMFGDILSDEAAMLTGSIGMLPSASLGDGPGLYEPVHGSAPDIAGRDIANPIAAIASAALLLRYSFGMEEAASAVESAIRTVLSQGYRCADVRLGATSVIGTTEMGQRIRAAL